MSKFPMIRTVGIICKHDKPEAWDAADRLAAWLTDRGIGSIVDPDTASYLDMKPTPKEFIPDKADVIVVFGGDGTLLSVARLIGTRGKPILGVNLGRLGFLTQVASDELYPTMETVLSGQYNVQERAMLDTRIKRDGKVISEHRVLTASTIPRSMRIRAAVFAPTPALASVDFSSVAIISASLSPSSAMPSSSLTPSSSSSNELPCRQLAITVFQTAVSPAVRSRRTSL